MAFFVFIHVFKNIWSTGLVPVQRCSNVTLDWTESPTLISQRGLRRVEITSIKITFPLSFSGHPELRQNILVTCLKSAWSSWIFLSDWQRFLERLTLIRTVLVMGDKWWETKNIWESDMNIYILLTSVMILIMNKIPLEHEAIVNSY